MNPQEFRLFEVNGEGLSYIVRELRTGKSLAKFLSAVVTTSGHVYALLPLNTEPGIRVDFESGGKLQGPPVESVGGIRRQKIPTADEAFSALIEEFLAFDQSRMCIFENRLASPSDGSLSGVEDVVVCDTEVYHVVTARRNGRSHISSALRTSRTTLEFVGALTQDASFIAPNCPGGHRSMERSDLERLAGNAACVFVGAYDGESVVIWSRVPLKTVTIPVLGAARQ